MALRYRILERFSQEAREAVAGKAFNPSPRSYGAYVCREGRCVFGALLTADGHLAVWPTPDSYEIAARLGVRDQHELELEISAIMDLNDGGKLRTRAAVRALLLGDAATPAPGGEEGEEGRR